MALSPILRDLIPTQPSQSSALLNLNDALSTPQQAAPPPVLAPGSLQGMSAAPSLPMLKPLVTSPRQQQEDLLQQKINSFENPKPEQPGFWHRLGHIAARIGNVAGDIVAPSTMALIPGTDLNNRLQHSGQMRELAGLQNEDRQDVNDFTANTLKNAQAAQAAEATAEMPGKTQAEEALQGAQAYRAIHPLATSAFELWHQQNPTGTAADYETLLQKPLSQQQADALNGVWDKSASKYGLPTGQFKAGMPASDANALSASLNNVISRGQGAQRITIEQQVADQKVPMIEPDGKGGYKLVYVQAGQDVNPNAVNPSGFSTENTPTAATRNMAEMAKTVLPQMQAVSEEVDKLANSLGPAVGRWNQLMVNKGGKDYPQFANLDTNLDLLASAIVRTHFGARGGQQYREELRKQFGEAQSPEDLKARIAGAGQWIEGYAHMADRGGNQNASGGNENSGVPTVGTIKEYGGANYKFKGGDQYDQKNWVKQ